MSAEIHPFPAHEETHVQRVGRLRAELRTAALEHADMVIDALQLAEAACRDIAKGGDPYPAGIRDRAARLADALQDGRQTLSILLERAS